jgi:hypothetical protein
MKRSTILITLGAAVSLTVLVPVPARAQLNGSHTLGDYGVQSGSQPLPGFYASLFYYRYNTDTIRNADGKAITLSPESPGSIGLTAVAPILSYVSKSKVFGANYGVLVVLPLANGSLEAPAFGLTQTIGTGSGDVLFRPFDLGWHTKRADVNAGLQFYAPTGRYVTGASDNIGKGMWTYEPFVGTTVYLDGKRTFSVATTAFWETHGNKKDSDVSVGNIVSLEGGSGKSFLGGGLVIGAAYYAQWKLTRDALKTFTLPGGQQISANLEKHHVFAIGPDVTLPIATKSKLFALVNIRYLWETRASLKTQGAGLLVTTTFPVPSVKLK